MSICSLGTIVLFILRGTIGKCREALAGVSDVIVLLWAPAFLIWAFILEFRDITYQR